MKYILIIFLLLLSDILLSQSAYTEVEGHSSIILNNRKDINHIKNSKYKNKLICEAIRNAINQFVPYTIQINEMAQIDFNEASNFYKDEFNLKLNSDVAVKWKIEGEPQIIKDYNIKNKWNCNVNGYVVELKRKPKPIIKETKNINIIIPTPTMKQYKYVGTTGRQR